MLATEVLWNIKQPQNTEVVVAQFKVGSFKSLPSWAHVVGRRVEGSSDLGGFDLCLTQSLDWDCFVRADAAVLNFEADDDDQDQEEEEEQEEFSAYSAISGTADAHNFSLASIWTTSRPRCMKFRVRWYHIFGVKLETKSHGDVLSSRRFSVGDKKTIHPVIANEYYIDKIEIESWD